MAEQIDYQKTQQFWENRGLKLGVRQYLLAATLQEDLPAIADYRDRTEKKHLFSRVAFSPSMRVLDLGGGAGRWALTIAPHVAEVTIVDFSSSMLEIARQRAKDLSVANVRFVKAAVTEFREDTTYDIILISGVLMYVNDDDVIRVMQNCRAMLASDGRIVIREGVKFGGRLVKNEEFVPQFNGNYSVIWRDPSEYDALLKDGLTLEYVNDAFPYLIPVFLFKRIVPLSWRGSSAGQSLLRGCLWLQSLVDPWLLLFPQGLRAYHRWLARQPLGFHAYLYIFRLAKKDAVGQGIATEKIRE